jgi:hypothetical protein
MIRSGRLARIRTVKRLAGFLLHETGTRGDFTAGAACKALRACKKRYGRAPSSVLVARSKAVREHRRSAFHHHRGWLQERMSQAAGAADVGPGTGAGHTGISRLPGLGSDTETTRQSLREKIARSPSGASRGRGLHEGAPGDPQAKAGRNKGSFEERLTADHAGVMPGREPVRFQIAANRPLLVLPLNRRLRISLRLRRPQPSVRQVS